MATMLKKALSVVATLLATASLAYAAPEIRPDHPESYVVKKGDTLWGISGRFLKNPWSWPEIWQANPQIENPHLIYPGDVVSLIYIDGKPHLVVNGGPGTGTAPSAGDAGPPPDIGPRMRPDEARDAVPPIPLAAVRDFLVRPRMLDEEALKSAPYVVTVEEDTIVGTDGRLAYVRQLDGAERGDRYVLARPTLRYRDVPAGWLWNRDEREVKAEPWSLADQWHWGLARWIGGRGEVLGHEVMEIGTVVVASGGDPATVYVSYSDFEVREGDLLLPAGDDPYPPKFQPSEPAGVPEGLRVIASSSGYDRTGPDNVVVLSRGAQDGLADGQVYSIYQPGKTVQDEVSYPKGSLREFVNPREKKVELPAEFVGHVMVFRTFDRVSYGLILNAVRPVNLGAELREPTQL
jgi:hypothetical protein